MSSVVLIKHCDGVLLFKAVKAASDVESDGAHLSGMPAIMLEGTATFGWAKKE